MSDKDRKHRLIEYLLRGSANCDILAGYRLSSTYCALHETRGFAVCITTEKSNFCYIFVIFRSKKIKKVSLLELAYFIQVSTKNSLQQPSILAIGLYCELGRKFNEKDVGKFRRNTFIVLLFFLVFPDFSTIACKALRSY